MVSTGKFTEIKKFCESRIDDIRDRMHRDDRRYSEHKKNTNIRLGEIEEKLGFLKVLIDVLKLQKEKQELEDDLNFINSQIKAFETAGKSKAKKRR
jgi:flagellar motility protein MotE (MotC chaperone)